MDKALKLKVKRVAETVRAWAEYQDSIRQWPTIDLNGWCAIASAQLHLLLKEQGIESLLMHQSDDCGCHVFCLVDDHVVDVTATQFGERWPKVVIMHQREAEAFSHWQADDMFFSAAELRTHQIRTKWPKDQTAYSTLKIKV